MRKEKHTGGGDFEKRRNKEGREFVKTTILSWPVSELGFKLASFTVPGKSSDAKSCTETA